MCKRIGSKYGDLASFSITSAATDVQDFILMHSNGASSIVYGLSYGTAWVERLMHLDPPGVVGYVLDGVAPASGAAKDTFPYFSTWETDFGKVGDDFLDLCAQSRQWLHVSLREETIVQHT
ncbi:unnamed protein product [Phytophthora lilii]|uniref:Unnamed protein product n=1 Tax=Phytophthora lilii TaxID=2077276 RepID=A0A9W6TGC1_9STRA|nr:unnamed protein product [Phytophthora lilii]